MLEIALIHVAHCEHLWGGGRCPDVGVGGLAQRVDFPKDLRPLGRPGPDHLPAKYSDREVFRFGLVAHWRRSKLRKSLRVQLAPFAYNGPLVQERFPVGWHPSGGSRYGLTFRMGMRRKQLHTLDHPLLFVIEEPILTRLEAGNDRMPRRRRML